MKAENPFHFHRKMMKQATNISGQTAGFLYYYLNLRFRGFSAGKVYVFRVAK